MRRGEANLTGITGQSLLPGVCEETCRLISGEDIAAQCQPTELHSDGHVGKHAKSAPDPCQGALGQRLCSEQCVVDHTRCVASSCGSPTV